MLLRRLRWWVAYRPSQRTIERIRRTKAERAAAAAGYRESPSVSVIVQSFNQRRNIDALEAGLRRTSADELIVCEDGSTDGSLERWSRRLRGPNEFLLRSNDLHEIRTYNRAIRFAQGEVACLMQDDDQPPKDGSWLEAALDLFARWPRLAVLGGWCGSDQFFEVEHNAPWLPAGTGRISHRDPQTQQPFMFVENVNIGPYLVRRSAFLELGGFDVRFSGPGEPGITFESEFCYRVWRSGWQVALTDIPVKQVTGAEGYILPGGTTLWDNRTRERNETANKELIRELHQAAQPAVAEAVRRANRLLDGAALNAG